MPPRELPARLSDDVFIPRLLGSGADGMAVKNTFLHLPAESPSPTASRAGQAILLTAPANMIGRMTCSDMFDTRSPLYGKQTPFPDASPATTIVEDVTPVSLFHDDSPPADEAPEEDGQPYHGGGEDADSQGWNSEDGGEDVQLTLLPPPPQAVPGAPLQHPSVGSAGHAAGLCRRCCFFPRGRCVSASACKFCHYEHDRRKNKRTKKRMPWPPAAPQYRFGGMPGGPCGGGGLTASRLNQLSGGHMAVQPDMLNFLRRAQVAEASAQQGGPGGGCSMPVVMHIVCQVPQQQGQPPGAPPAGGTPFDGPQGRGQAAAFPQQMQQMVFSSHGQVPGSMPPSVAQHAARHQRSLATMQQQQQQQQQMIQLMPARFQQQQQLSGMQGVNTSGQLARMR